jgi:hypothetical protein
MRRLESWSLHPVDGLKVLNFLGENTLMFSCLAIYQHPKVALDVPVLVVDFHVQSSDFEILQTQVLDLHCFDKGTTVVFVSLFSSQIVVFLSFVDQVTEPLLRKVLRFLPALLLESFHLELF